MSYTDVAAMVEDWELRMRLIACAAIEQQEAPVAFVEENIWRICAQPDFAKAWGRVADAVANDEGYKPGADESVVSDAMILAAMHRLVVDLEVSAATRSRSVADDTTARLQAEDERVFANHVRMRLWDLAHQRPEQVPHLVTDDHPDPEADQA